MAAATRPAFRHLRVGNPQVSSAPKCTGSREAMMNPGQLNALAGGADSGEYVLWAGSPWHRCWSGRRKGGSAMRKVMESLMLLLARIRKVITGQRWGSQDAAEPGSLRSAR